MSLLGFFCCVVSIEVFFFLVLLILDFFSLMFAWHFIFGCFHPFKKYIVLFGLYSMRRGKNMNLQKERVTTIVTRVVFKYHLGS